MVFIDLIYNLSLLIALSVVSGFVDTRQKRDTWLGVLLQGVVFGGAAVIGMLRPFVFAPGLIFDGRSVMISLGGLFFGPWTAAVACLMTIPLRVAQGGPGALAGVLVILSSALIGVVFHLFRRREPQEESTSRLLLFGLLVHLAMLAMMFTLPANMALSVLKHIGWPVMLIYPLATILIGKILSDQATRHKFLLALRENQANLEQRIVERKKLEEELRLSENRYRVLFEKSKDAIFIADPQTRMLIDCNMAALKMTGYSKEEIFLMRADQLHPKDRVDEVMGEFKKHAAGEDIMVESVVLTKAGQRVFVSINTSIVELQGKTYLMGVFRDITEIKKVEMVLQESEERFRSLFENMLSGFAYCKMLFDEQNLPQDFVYLNVNGAFERLTGLKNVTGKKVTEAIPGTKEMNPELLEIYGRVALTGKPEVFEIDFKPLEKWLSVSVYSQKKGYFVAIFDDITERKLTNKAIVDTKDYLDAIINSIADPIFVKDRNHVWVLLNDEFCRFLGHPRQSLIGKSDYEFFPKEQADVFWRQDEIVFESGEENTNQEKFTDSKGKIHTIVTKKTLYRDTEGKKFLVGIIRDIADIKLAEEELKKKIKELEVFNKASVDRELKMVELKKKIAKLERGLVEERPKDK